MYAVHRSGVNLPYDFGRGRVLISRLVLWLHPFHRYAEVQLLPPDMMLRRGKKKMCEKIQNNSSHFHAKFYKVKIVNL